jgi:Bcr/CflA subfamily drug resistance transporter
MKQYKTLQLVLILTPFVFSFAFGLDIYIPIVPQMTEIFNTSPNIIQLTLSLFLLITGIGQLLVGPLSDQFGRKRVFYVASFLFALGSIVCAVSPHVIWLIIGRVISAFGACGMLVNSFALVRDLYGSDKSAKIYSFLNGAIGISPTFAPIIGGYLSLYFGWQSVFFFLGAIGIFAIIVTNTFIQETLQPVNRVKIDNDILKRYVSILSNRQFLIYALMGGCAESVFFCFFSISPFMIIDLHGIPTHEFGYYFAVFGSVIALGGFLSGKITEKFGIQKTIMLGIMLMFFGGFSMLAWDYFYDITLSGFLIPMAFACTGAMFLVGGTASMALEPFPLIAGTASAAFGAFEFGIASLVGSLLMLFPVVSSVPYGFFIVILAAICLQLLPRNEMAKDILE